MCFFDSGYLVCVDGIECFAIDMSSATQNLLKIPDGQG